MSEEWRRIAGRRARLAQLRAGLALARRERLLAAGTGPAGGYTLAATDRALYHRAHGGAWTRLGWEQVTRVSWDTGRQATITGLNGAAGSCVVVPLRGSGSMPEIAMERITHTRLGSWDVVLPGDRRVRVEARRRPVTGELLWFVSADGGSGLGTGQLHLHAQVERAIAGLSAQYGLPRHAPVSLPWPRR